MPKIHIPSVTLFSEIQEAKTICHEWAMTIAKVRKTSRTPEDWAILTFCGWVGGCCPPGAIRQDWPMWREE